MLNTLSPNSLYTSHQGQNSGTGPSPRLLSHLTNVSTNPDGQTRAFKSVEEDFAGHWNVAPGISGTTTGTVNRFSYYLDTTTSACSIASSTTLYGGVINIATGTTDNHEFSLKGGVAGQLDEKLFVFEARVVVGAAGLTTFVGLTAPGAAATNFITDADALSDTNHFGFFISATGDLTFVAKKTGVAVLTLGTTAKLGSVLSGTHKLGFKYGARTTEGKLVIYIDGVEKVRLDASDIPAASVPLAIPLAPIVAGKNAAAGVETLGVDFLYAVHAMS